ncbi:ATP-dependent endonuclease [Vibrio parahaemolyticus]|uniref:ATP-dependent nuclease n=1 Tax=Vibrio parahaemolyticus TaxID=670 RepID=UPI000A3964A6|nr:AAA family ATPase [Vibrio parahaemolyticus]EIW7482797.1 AAA family ATPase [Vibrio parahaemolyticus]EKZ9249667.1 AAA family ATPase [Vibrio parahaemolyticus]ELA6678857.1 AAA family ATPase [Vibrio parahaemolyticus]ELI6471423.1 AAA family ATPase [Vibrio parahaemolyticus]MBE4081197.1 AAA family ATPase [Vibrio parahaemolyticus]
MYIRKVTINNYRSFRFFEAQLQQLTVVIGENDTGKTNFFTALSLPLSGNQIDFNQKRLSVSDINKDAVIDFLKSVVSDDTEENQLEKIPKVSVTVEFADPKDAYETALLAKWIVADRDEETYKIRYDFKPKDDKDLLEVVKKSLAGKTLDDINWLTLPVELYDYQIVSVNNEKPIAYSDLKHVSIHSINAERDDFSESSSMKSNSIFTKLLMNTLDDDDKGQINTAYSEFFSAIEKTETFDKIIGNNEDFENYDSIIKQLECTPNLPNLKNILSNITLKYGNEFLYQKGLGQRNLIYILILFAYYKSCSDTFNLCCIEEPEAHLSVNNLRLVRDFIEKSSSNSGSLVQTIISTHNPSIINKLKISNVLAFTGEKAISLSDTPTKLVDYLRKRPNFDILKLLFAHKVILVEGPTEEMLISTYLSKQPALNDIDIIPIGQRGYATFLDIWLALNKDNQNKKIGVVRDYDNSESAKKRHDAYDTAHANVTVRTTTNYTLEIDLVEAEDNLALLNGLFKMDGDLAAVSDHMINGKTARMLDVCDAMVDEENPLDIQLPAHIAEVIGALS